MPSSHFWIFFLALSCPSRLSDDARDETEATGTWAWIKSRSHSEEKFESVAKGILTERHYCAWLYQPPTRPSRYHRSATPTPSSSMAAVQLHFRARHVTTLISSSLYSFVMLLLSRSLVWSYITEGDNVFQSRFGRICLNISHMIRGYLHRRLWILLTFDILYLYRRF